VVAVSFGKQSRVTEVCSMESKKDDPLKARFLTGEKGNSQSLHR
jgi:hypothetical protein